MSQLQIDALNIEALAAIASSATVDLESSTGDLVDISGTTAITRILLLSGHERTVRFTGILTLTNGANLVLPGGTDITTAVGDFAVFRGYVSGVVRCVAYSAIAASGTGDMILNAAQTVTGAKTFGAAGAVGKLKVAGTTSGSTIIDATAAAGSGTVTLPTTGTLATLAGTEALTNKTLTAPVIGTGLTASGSAANDFSASTGTFKTSSGANQLTGTTTALGLITTAAGTTALANINTPSGTLKTTAAAGDHEFDGASSYITNEATAGRGMVAVDQYFRLTTPGGAISTIANYFGANSNIVLVANAFYEIDIYAFFVKSTAGTVVWTFTNSANPTGQDIYYEMSPETGIVAPPGTATMLIGQILNNSTAALALAATGTLSSGLEHFMHTKIWLQNGTGTSLKIQATCSAGTITPQIGSRWFCRRLPATSTGLFAA